VLLCAPRVIEKDRSLKRQTLRKRGVAWSRVGQQRSPVLEETFHDFRKWCQLVEKKRKKKVIVWFLFFLL